MNRAEFEKLIADEFPNAVPEKFRAMVKNVAFLVEDAPSAEVRREEGLARNETLLGLYRGVPRAMRGDYYGVGPTLPDVITLYRLPIHSEANEVANERGITPDEALRTVVGETIWHEVAHYLGLGEAAVREREEERRKEKEDASPSDESKKDAPHQHSSRTGEAPENLPTLEE